MAEFDLPAACTFMEDPPGGAIVPFKTVTGWTWPSGQNPIVSLKREANSGLFIFLRV